VWWLASAAWWVAGSQEDPSRRDQEDRGEVLQARVAEKPIMTLEEQAEILFNVASRKMR